MPGVVRLTINERELIADFLRDKLDEYVFVAQRLLSSSVDNSMVLATLHNAEIQSLLLLAGNAVPINLSNEVAKQYAASPYVKYSQIASIVGKTPDVTHFWSALNNDSHRVLRLVRERQPYLRLNHEIEGYEDVDVHYITLEHYEQYFKASYDMFIGEVGRAPNNLDHYQGRLRYQIQNKRAFGVFDKNDVLRFKVDVPIWYQQSCQVQGVWMHPEWRGKGLARQYFGATLQAIQRDIAVNVTLYVNDFNLPALNLYRGIGFTEITQYSTIFLDI